MPGREATPLSSEEWNAAIEKLAGIFISSKEESGKASGRAIDRIPAGKLSRLEEGEDRFYVMAVIGKSDDRLTLLSVDWEKESFDQWWSKARGQAQAKESGLTYQYSLPEINSTTASDGWTPTIASAPNSRINHSAVWTGSEMIIWGGQDSSCCSGIFPVGGARYNPATDSWISISITNSPNPRANHSAVWTGSEMIVWGGNDNGNNYNTGGRYNPATDSWTGINTAGAPLPRTSHTGIWTGSEMIVWGGADSTGCCSTAAFNTGGRYNPSTDSWTATSTPTAPSARQSHKAVWTGTVMIVWGGTSNSGSVNTGGRYNPSTNTWTGTNTAGAPNARANHTAVWSGSEMIVWGGGPGSCCGSDSTGGRYNPVTDSWIPTSLIGAPSARTLHTAVWTGSVMIVWGGQSNFSGNLGVRYSPGTDSWTATSNTNAPSDRSSHTAIWTGSEMVIWGGSTFSGNQAGGRYNPGTNSWLATSTSVAPSPRERHTAVWTGAEMIIWGGIGPVVNFGSPIVSTGGRYVPALDNWVATNTSNPPAARYNHTAVWTGTEMIVWGGYDGSSVINSGGHYNPSSNSWTQAGQVNAPFARYLHTAIWSGSEMIVWGGSDGFNYFNSGGKYNPSTGTWQSTDLLTAPSARDSHTAVWTGSVMIVWGGFNSSIGYSNNGSRYNPSSNSWTAVSNVNAPGARIQHTAVWGGADMIVWGGFDGASRLNTGGKYNPGTNSWTATSLVNAPSPRSLHTAVRAGAEMIIWGGSDGVGSLNNGSQYQIAANGWAATTTTNAPSARERHTAVWTGSEMIVWGGSDGVNQLNTGSRFLPPLCNFFLSMTNQFCSAGGGECNVNVTAATGCNWTAGSNAEWITVYAGTSGTGNGSVSFVIRENHTTEPRVGTLNIAGQTFTVNQDSTSANCTYAVSPAFNTFTAAGGNGNLQVITESRCAWEAVSRADWITITSNSIGIGNGTISYSVSANPGPGGRSGVITVGGRNFTIKQKGS